MKGNFDISSKQGTGGQGNAGNRWSSHYKEVPQTTLGDLDVSIIICTGMYE